MCSVLLFCSCVYDYTIYFPRKAPYLSFTELHTHRNILSSSQILKQIKQTKMKEGYTLKNITFSDKTYARVRGSKPNLEIEILKQGDFSATLILEHKTYEDAVVKKCKISATAPKLSFTELTTYQNTIKTDAILKQVGGLKDGYTVKTIRLHGNAKNIARVAQQPLTGLQIEILKNGDFTATIVLEKDEYFDVTLPKCEFKITPFKFSFTKLIYGINAGKTIGTARIVAQIPNAKKQGYALKSITISDKSYATVRGTKPNLEIEILKTGNFTAAIVLEKAGHLDVTIQNCQFEITNVAFTFNKLKRNSNGGKGKIITSDDLLDQTIPDAKSKGYLIKSITLSDTSYGRISSKPAYVTDKYGSRLVNMLQMEVLKPGNFSATIVLQKAGLPDVTVQNCEVQYTITFEKNLGQRLTDTAHSIVAADNGDYVVVGSRSVIAGFLQPVAYRLNSKGETVWYKETDGFSAEWVVATSDGGFVLGGLIYPGGGKKSDLYALKLDAAGNKVWIKNFGGTEYDSFSSLIATSDGGFLVLGSKYIDARLTRDMYVIKLDKDGNTLWEKTFGNSGRHAQGADAAVEVPGGFVVAGYIQSTATSFDPKILKLDSNGTLIWEKTYSKPERTSPESIIQTPDGGFMLAGSSTNTVGGHADLWVSKLDSNGNQLWEKFFGGQDGDDANAMVATADGGFAVVGDTWVTAGGHRDLWLLKFDSAGNKVWDKTFGFQHTDQGGDLIQTKDGGFAVVGQQLGPHPSFWVLKLDESGNLGN